MTDERIDLGALDPGRDPDRIERIAGAVRAAIDDRPRARVWTTAIGRAWFPSLLAAAVAGLLALAAPRLAGHAPSRPEPDPLAVWVGVPVPLAAWATAEEPPTAAEVLAALEGTSR